MSVDKIQARLNEVADKKLKEFIKAALGDPADTAKKVRLAYKDALIDRGDRPTTIIVIDVYPIGPDGKTGNYVKAQVQVGSYFFEKFEEALFKAAQDAARQMETDAFLAKVGSVLP